jgi:hypothetical protein
MVEKPRDEYQWPECANSGHAQAALQTDEVDPWRTFGFDPQRGEDAQERTFVFRIVAAHRCGRGGGAFSPPHARA